MKRINLVVLSIMLGFVFVISLASSSFAAEEKKMQTIEGKILCVEADQKGHVTAVEKSDCTTGVSVLVGKDGKLYTLYGSEKQIKEMAMEGKVSGEVEGSQRAWIIYAGGVRPSEKPEEETVSGTVYCLLPNYENGTVTPVIATGPCVNLPPHAHVMVTKDRKVYAIEGSPEAIHKMESGVGHPQGGMNVTMKGKLEGHQGGWVLFVE
jgi:hypothetical protein